MSNKRNLKQRIEDANEEYRKYGYEWYETDTGDVSVRKLNTDKCSNCGSVNNWKLYKGFRHDFEYCGDCGQEKKK